MAVKEELRALIDRLDDEQASVMLVIGERVERGIDVLRSEGDRMGVDVDPDTLMLLTRPMTKDDTFWSDPPTFSGDVPSDLSTNHDHFLAQIYGDLHDK
jgi:hypothetical protein